MAVESDESRAELLKFEGTLRHECEYKSLYGAWQFCGPINEWYTNFPHHMKLWQKKCLSFPQVLQFVIGDSQNNFLSNHLRASLKLDLCFDVSIIMRDQVGQYGLEGNI